MITNPKSKCCGADIITEWISTGINIHRCLQCGQKCDLQDQPTSRLDDLDNITCNSNWLKCLEESNCYLSTNGKIVSRELTKANEELFELRKDKVRLRHYFSQVRDHKSSRFIELELRVLANDNPSLKEWVKAIDDDIAAIAAQEKMK